MLGVPCVAVVAIHGELSTAALLAVAVTGVALASVGLVRRAGEAAPPVGRRGLPWLAWLAAAGSWELLTLAANGLTDMCSHPQVLTIAHAHKPYLSSTRVTGDVGQGARADTAPAFSLTDPLRSGAG